MGDRLPECIVASIIQRYAEMRSNMPCIHRLNECIKQSSFTIKLVLMPGDGARMLCLLSLADLYDEYDQSPQILILWSEIILNTREHGA